MDIDKGQSQWPVTTELPNRNRFSDYRRFRPTLRSTRIHLVRGHFRCFFKNGPFHPYRAQRKQNPFQSASRCFCPHFSAKKRFVCRISSFPSRPSVQFFGCGPVALSISRNPASYGSLFPSHQEGCGSRRKAAEGGGRLKNIFAPLVFRPAVSRSAPAAVPVPIHSRAETRCKIASGRAYWLVEGLATPAGLL